MNLEHVPGQQAPLSRVGPFADAIQQRLTAKLDGERAFAPPAAKAKARSAAVGNTL